MIGSFEKVLEELSPIQEEAVSWQEGSVLVLAGPGAGKTRVLTTRIARLLTDSPDRKFKVLALTFTTKAAAEMRELVDVMVPGVADERTFIGTFHAFCTQVLRQHGSHIGIRPDFGIYDQKKDREEILADVIQESVDCGEDFSVDDIRWLDLIDELRAKVITPEKAASSNLNPRMVRIYRLYEKALQTRNLLDFNGLILESCRLFAKFPAVAERIRRTYPYWMIDEFQDTSQAQYWLLHYLAGSGFNNIFVVADDDQIIYQWAGASYRQIERFRDQFKPTLIQLVENHRCPPEIVALANKLVAHNTMRVPDKKQIIPARKVPLNAVSLRTFESDLIERETLADEIASLGKEKWGRVAVLARTRSLLEPMLNCFRVRNVRAVMAQRRDDFISPQFVWLQACLDQVLRPTNKRVFATLVNTADRVVGIDLDPKVLIAEAEADGHSFFEHWARNVASTHVPVAQKLGHLVQALAQSRNEWKNFTKTAIPILLETASTGEGAISDVTEDHRAWETCLREIRSEKGEELDLSELVQGLALRSKEPPREPDTVALLTVHAAKGLEFDFVYIIGLAEGEMPSWQSQQKGDASPEMEEERRNCFVAITRTKERLTLSLAENYRGWKKNPSRFLHEIAILEPPLPKQE